MKGHALGRSTRLACHFHLAWTAALERLLSSTIMSLWEGSEVAVTEASLSGCFKSSNSPAGCSVGSPHAGAAKRDASEMAKKGLKGNSEMLNVGFGSKFLPVRFFALYVSMSNTLIPQLLPTDWCFGRQPFTVGV